MGDIAVGAYGEDKLAGVVYILFLQASATTPVLGWYKVRAKTPGFQFFLAPNDAFGASVAGMGDVDGDGVPDLAVGAYMDKDVVAGGGAVYILLLQRPAGAAGVAQARGLVPGGNSPVKVSVKITPGTRGFGDTSLQANAFFGAAVAGFKDLDNDGVPELLVGTIGDNRANPNAGAVHLLYLGLNTTGDGLPVVKDWRKITTGVEGFKGTLPANTNFGAALAELPDLSGDNETEIAVGSYVASNASVYFLYKNSLTSFSESPPQIYAVVPPLLDTIGGENVTMALSIDITMMDIDQPYIVEAYLGLSPCLYPKLTPYDEAAKGGLVSATVGARGGVKAVVVGGGEGGGGGAMPTPVSPSLVPFPAVLASKNQIPYILTCVSTEGVGGHLLAQATISQGGADIPLLMANAVSYQPPTVSSITTTGTQARGGFDVTVTGRHFGAADFQPLVLVQDTPCEAAVWVSDTQVVCRGAPSGLGQAEIKVSVGGQTSVPGPAAAFAYDVPVLTGWNISTPMTVSLPVFGGYSIDLPFSPYTGGKEVLSLWGSNFGPAGSFPKVMIGGWECTDALVESDGLVSCTTPPGVGGNLSISMSLGGVEAASPQPFTFAAPLLVTVVPETANTEGGDLVIMGRNFGAASGALEVLIGDQMCKEVKMVYEHQLITCKYPPGTGKDLPMLVTVSGQSNTPPRAFNYADTYGQRTVEAIFLLVGESLASFDAKKQAVFEQIVLRAMEYDPTLSIADDAVHICNVTSLTGEMNAGMAPLPPGAAPPTASKMVIPADIYDVFATLDAADDDAAVVDDGGEGDKSSSSTNMAGGGHRHVYREESVLVSVDITAANAKIGASFQAWLKVPEHQALLQTYLNSKDTGIRVVELRVIATSVTSDLYCPPGQQQQDIGSNNEKACFLCPVGSYQPLRSKQLCQPCPVGADCLRQGIDVPVPLAGFWRQPLPLFEATKIDPYFVKYRIYGCNPPDVCLGGAASNCTEGHLQGSPLCAICEEGFYGGGTGVCKPCGSKRAIQITVFFALSFALAAFFMLLYFFVRPGDDIDEAVGSIKERLLEGPGGKSFNRELNMSYFLSNTLSRHLASRITELTDLPDMWSKAKISITFFQIIASLNVAYTVPWPREFTRLLRKLNVLNLNILNIPGMAYSCVQPIDFFAEFLVALLFPIVLTFFFVILHRMGVRVIKKKVHAHLDMVRALEAQSATMKNQLLRKMRAISIRMLKRRPRRSLSSSVATAAAAAAAAGKGGTAASSSSTSSTAPQSMANPLLIADVGAAEPMIRDSSIPTIQEEGSGAFTPVPPPPLAPLPVVAQSSSQSSSDPVLDTQGSGMYLHDGPPSSSSSPTRSRGDGAVSSPVLLPMPPQAHSRFCPSPPPLAATGLPSRPTSPVPPPPPPPPPGRSPLALPSATALAAAAASSQPPEPSPTVRSAVIDIFSPRPHPSSSLSSAASSSSSSPPHKHPSMATSEESAQSGGSGGACSSSSSSSSHPPKVKKKATFSDTVTESSVLDKSLGKDESLGGASKASSSSTTTGAGALQRVDSATDDDEDESIVEIKHKLLLLEKQENVEQFSIERYTSRLITFWFWIILLIYPAVSRVVLESVNCRTLDNGRKYLVTDFTIDCQSPYYLHHMYMIVPALALYPIGIPLMFFLLLKFRRNVHPWDDNLSFLYKAYRKQYWWFEIYELLRKLLLTGLIIFIAAGTATQIAIACIICAVTMCLHLRLRPYEARGDDILQGFSLAEVLLVTYCALLLKLDLTGADEVSVHIFDVVLITTNAVVVLGIMPASFYLQGREYMSRLKSTLSFSLPALMKREVFNRLAICFFLLLTIWAALANSVYDPITVTITTASLGMLVYCLLLALYFFPPINTRLPSRYRIISVLAPKDCFLEEEGGGMSGMYHASSKSLTTGGAGGSSGFVLKGGGAGGGKDKNLSKLNARKLEAIKAAGLSTDQLNSRLRRRTDSGGEGGDPAGPTRRPSLNGQRSSLDSSFSRQPSGEGGMDTSLYGGSVEGQGPDASWLGRFLLVPWTWVVRKRRLADPICAVLMVDLAVMCADEGKGTANYARLVMLVGAAFFTLLICAFPHVKDARPPPVSPLRMVQCFYALSTINMLLASIQAIKGASNGGGERQGLAIFARVAAIFASVLCALHALAGILRGLRAALPGPYNNLDATANKQQQQQQKQPLMRADSTYGGTKKSSIVKDLILLLLLILTVTGLVITRPRHLKVVPICMMVGLALLFSYKPLRALREARDEFVGQLLMLQVLVKALWPQRGRHGRQKSGGGKGGAGGHYTADDHDYIFDEHDLSAATRPEALAAEVMRLRRKVAEMEDRLEEDGKL